jgi:acyl dehydratase
MVTIENAAFLKERIGQELAVSDWIEITQARIDLFAEATDDRQWIHVDPVRAAAESPFRTPIAHGFLTLSLVAMLARRTFAFADLGMAINYGVNRVRFVAPVPAGSRIRARFAVAAAEELADSLQVTWGITIEREGGRKPVCVAEWILRYFGKQEREKFGK